MHSHTLGFSALFISHISIDELSPFSFLPMTWNIEIVLCWIKCNRSFMQTHQGNNYTGSLLSPSRADKLSPPYANNILLLKVAFRHAHLSHWPKYHSFKRKLYKLLKGWKELLWHIICQKFLLLLISIMLVAVIVIAKSMSYSFMVWLLDFKVSLEKCEAFKVHTQSFPWKSLWSVGVILK